VLISSIWPHARSPGAASSSASSPSAKAALKTISPAVNDLSTAITCLDQVSGILIRWISRHAPEVLLSDPPHVLRVVMPAIDLDGPMDTAFEQIRHYDARNFAMSARLLRAMDDIAASTDDLRIRALVAARATCVRGLPRLAGRG
jgi:uncharacterized membrane protein